uniref:Glycoprotein Ib platelet subunit beta n=1 Tax=Calidris pygmaea TaxID=425635 RepID=A0A8C3J2N2_9CHAR
MNSGILLFLLGFLPLVLASCPVPCKCATNIIDCTSKGLTVAKLPVAFRPSAEIIHLGYNRLTSIPNGLFDNLRSLQVVYLQGNPWECNCDILYLRSWLQWQQNRSMYRDVRCATPAHLQDRNESLLFACSFLAEFTWVRGCLWCPWAGTDGARGTGSAAGRGWTGSSLSALPWGAGKPSGLGVDRTTAGFGFTSPGRQEGS